VFAVASALRGIKVGESVLWMSPYRERRAIMPPCWRRENPEVRILNKW
jgi:hypothetical protein